MSKDSDNIFNTLIKNVNLGIYQSRINVTNISSNYIQINEVLESKIYVSELDNIVKFSQSFLSDQKYIELFLIKTDTASKISDLKTLKKIVAEIKEQYDFDEDVSFKINKIQRISLPLNKTTTIEYCLETNFKELILQLIDNLRVSDLRCLENKIRISGSFIPNVISSIFSFRLETEKIDYELSNFIQIQSKYDRNISSVPFLIDSTDFLSSNLSRRIMIDALSNLFDNKNGTSLLIIKQSVKVIEIDKLTGDFERCYEIISRINEFIFGEPSNYREKLRILRNLLYEGIDEENNNIYDQDFWNKLLILSINEYNIYVDEKVTKFISEKKEIIKEQFSMSKEISNQIAETKKSLMNNIVSIIGIFLSKFIFDAISRNDEHFSFFSYLIALFFSVYLLVIYFISGEFKSYQTYVKRVEIMNTYYPKLYLTKDNIIGDLEEKISNPEIKKLKYVNITAGICYVFFVILFLQRLGFFDLFIRTIFTPDK